MGRMPLFHGFVGILTVNNSVDNFSIMVIPVIHMYLLSKQFLLNILFKNRWIKKYA